MEPSDFDFARSVHFLDAQGENVDLGASIGGRSHHSLSTSKVDVGGPLGASFRHQYRLQKQQQIQHRRNRQKTLSNVSHWSDNTLVQSVLLADGLVAADQFADDWDESEQPNEDDDELLRLQAIPSRYANGSVKAKVTWFGILCLSGIGMFMEAYVIISTGQVKTIWHAEYPECWDSESYQPCPNHIACCGLFPNTPPSQPVCDNDAEATAASSTTNHSIYCTADTNQFPNHLLCTKQQTGGVSYAEFAGIMAGMLTFGYIADLIGRKRAGCITAFFMIAGVGGMAFFNSNDVSTLFIVFSVFFAIFGLGTGGEYPLTATQAAEQHAESAVTAAADDLEQRQHRLLLEVAKTARRGETISLVFAMQGIGAVVGSVFILIFIYFSGQGRSNCDSEWTNSHGVVPEALESVWRSFYFVGLVFLILILLYRWLILEEGQGFSMVAIRKQKREQKLGYGIMKKRYWEIFWFYFPRLIGTGGNWLVWDVAFYGLKLFSGPIFRDINPGGDLVVQNGYILINNLCALVGYYCAAIVIDRPSIGRKRLQMFSLLVSGAIFILTAAIFDTASTGVIMFLFFASSFFGQFGANVTTYVMAAETYPTELRGTFHGLSAFLGKIGALIANIGFGYLETKQIFWVCGACGIAGVIFTYVFSVDLTGVSLAEHDAQLELLYAGQRHRYKGKLNERKHLSNFDLWTGRHGKYDKEWVRGIICEEKIAPANLPQTQPEIKRNPPIVEDEMPSCLLRTS